MNISDNDPWMTYCDGRNLNENFTCTGGNTTYENKYCKTLNFLRQRPDTKKPDFRYNWPAQIFTRVCKCTGNWFGYDCSRCKRGYGGPDCTEKKQDFVVRKSFLDLSASEKNRIIEILNMAKYMESDFTVPIAEPPTSTGSFKSLSLYDVFATFHYYTIRDDEDTLKEENKLLAEYRISDFAHEGPGFLPWHRAYLLYFETELQHMLNDNTFALPYWDWTAYDALKDRNDIECPDIFSVDLFGKNGLNCCEAVVGVSQPSGKPIMTDNFVWEPICVNYKDLTENGMLCMPNENNITNESQNFITRCVGCTIGKLQCRAKGMLPSDLDVKKVFKELQYDVCNYDKGSNTNGFRNAIEGFYDFNNVNSITTYGSNASCCGFAEMHNKVHLYIGGLMMQVLTSSNDPIFWLHHSNIDRLYDKWLEDSEADILYKPVPTDNSVEYRVGVGHNGNDNAGLLFPPITIAEAHKHGSEFGYSYQDPISCTVDDTPSPSSISSTSSTSSTSSSTTRTTSNPTGTDPTPGGTDPTSGGTKPTTGRDPTSGGTNPNPTDDGASSLHQNYLVSFVAGYLHK